MNNFKELKVWQKSIDLVVDLYSSMTQMPKDEQYNLTSQMQRAAVSISSNLAEGCGRNSSPAFKQFCSISLRSAYELETQLIISNKLGFLEENTFVNLHGRLTEVQKMTRSLMLSLS